MSRTKKAKPAPVAPPAPEVSNPFNAAGLLDARHMTLLKKLPTNPAVRGQILADTGVWIPEDCTTLEQVLDYLNTASVVPGSPASARIRLPFSATTTAKEAGRITYRLDIAGRYEGALLAADFIAAAKNSPTLERFLLRVRKWTADLGTIGIVWERIDLPPGMTLDLVASREIQDTQCSLADEEIMEFLKAVAPAEYARLTGEAPAVQPEADPLPELFEGEDTETDEDE